MHYGINVHATNSYTIFVHTCNKYWVQAQCFKTQKQTKRHPCLHCRQQLYYAHILANICQIIWFHEKKNNKKWFHEKNDWCVSTFLLIDEFYRVHKAETLLCLFTYSIEYRGIDFCFVIIRLICTLGDMK